MAHTPGHNGNIVVVVVVVVGGTQPAPQFAAKTVHKQLASNLLHGAQQAPGVHGNVVVVVVVGGTQVAPPPQLTGS